jgi:hypothetical protein
VVRDSDALASLVAQEALKFNNRHERKFTMFTLKDYVGVHWQSLDWNDVRIVNAQNLILACAKLQDIMEANNVHFQINPKTGTTISGETYGGFRPQDCPIGAPASAHKQGQAVDRYDPGGKIDVWLVENESALEECGIYIEMPSSTPGWSHWSTRAPASGHHIFMP